MEVDERELNIEADMMAYRGDQEGREREREKRQAALSSKSRDKKIMFSN